MHAEIPADSSEPMRLQDQHYIRQKLYSGAEEHAAAEDQVEVEFGRRLNLTDGSYA